MIMQEAKREIEKLCNELTTRIHMCDMRSEKILELTAERDEARRRICNDSLRMGRVFRRIGGQNVECSTPQDVAEMMGWDCFKENNK